MDQEISALFDRNIARVENLVSLYGKKGPGRKNAKDTDILRAAVVLLHASMEDFLRSLLISKIADFDRETLNKFPLPNLGGKAPQKFLLGNLAEHRGKTVDALIVDAVTVHLEQFSSFNSLGDVKKALNQCGIENKVVEDQGFGVLPDMINRRHNIVHKADRNENIGGQGNHHVKSIAAHSLNKYVAAVKDLKAFVEENLR